MADVSKPFAARSAVFGALSGSLLLLGNATTVIAADATPAFEDKVRPILAEYCFSCHGPEKTKGDLDLAKFESAAKAMADKDVWRDVGSRVRDRDMPPQKQKQPSDEQRKTVLAWIERSVGADQVDCSKIASDETQKFYRGHVMSRRLNRTEYNNTLRDLLGIDLRAGDELPEDGAGGEGFDTTGDTLFISAIQIEKYLRAADRVAGAVLWEGKRPADLVSEGDAKAAQARILIASPGDKLPPREAAKKNLTAFARRAFRRPTEAGEVDRLLTLFDRAQQRGDSYLASMRLAIKSVLISPHFLFLTEPEDEKGGVYRLSDYPLASRLSYFLWSSMPDEELFKLAETHKLGETDVLRRQVRRMLRDPKSRALGENFARQWLGITALGGASRPDAKRFPDFDDDLITALREEAVLSFDSIVREDRSLLDLLDCDSTFLNERLAKHYGIGGVTGEAMRKVHLTGDDRQRRGGVLGLGAVLVSTSYPLRTSPVLRGKWVLEELLGGKVPPPPPSAGQLPPDDKQADGLTFRQRLEKHRSNAECASCHQKMDPLGFGLENFDAVGRWRSEQGGAPVDASGVLPSGEKFAGPRELRQVLLKHQDEFLRTFCRKMLGYGLGRGLSRFDDCVVNDAMKALVANNHHASALFEQIVLSTPFRYRYAKK